MDYVLFSLIVPIGLLLRRTATFAHRPDRRLSSYLSRKS